MSGYHFAGFERRDGRVVARFRGDDGDARAIPLDASDWLPHHEDEQPHPDPAVRARLIGSAAQLAALARTAHVVLGHGRARRSASTGQRRRSGRPS